MSPIGKVHYLRFKFHIIGAGAAGSALANRLRNRLEGAEITIVDPARSISTSPASRWSRRV
jgi:NADH dehydrogenase FAD-containing subunit